MATSFFGGDFFGGEFFEGAAAPEVVATVAGGRRRHHFIWRHPEEEEEVKVVPKRKKYVAKPTVIHDAIMSFAPRSIVMPPSLPGISIDVPRPIPKDEDEEDFMNFLEME
jgi:hypothetical protein